MSDAKAKGGLGPVDPAAYVVPAGAVRHTGVDVSENERRVMRPGAGYRIMNRQPAATSAGGLAPRKSPAIRRLPSR
jgi:hypothetical protein